jgi:tight adherence protein B
MILLATFAAAMLGVVAAVSLTADLWFRDRIQIRKRLARDFQPQHKPSPQKSPLFRDLTALHAKTAGGRRQWRDWWLLFTLQVERSGLPWSPQLIAGMAFALSAAAAVGIYLVTRQWIGAAVAGVVGFQIPFFGIEAQRQRRRGQLCRQLPDAFDQMKRSIRSGQSIMTAMRQIADEFPAPLANEFETCCQQQELGLPQAAALQDFARRVNIMELQLFVVAVLVQRDVGGNSAEMLGNLAQVVRQRFRLASRVKALTGEGRMQAIVLALLPLLAGGLILAINPEYAQVLLDRPNVLLALLASEIIGALWIRRIVNFEY